MTERYPASDREHIAMSCIYCDADMEYVDSEIGIACESYAYYECPKCGAKAKEVYQYDGVEWESGKE